MTRAEYINEAVKLCVGKAEETGICFIEPLWEDIAAAELGDRPDDLSREQLFEILDLVAKKANAYADHTRFVMDWIYDLVAGNIDPALTQEENELMKNVMEYMKLNDKLKDKEKELNEKEEAVEKKTDLAKMFPGRRFDKGL